MGVGERTNMKNLFLVAAFLAVALGGDPRDPRKRLDEDLERQGKFDAVEDERRGEDEEAVALGLVGTRDLDDQDNESGPNANAGADPWHYLHYGNGYRPYGYGYWSRPYYSGYGYHYYGKREAESVAELRNSESGPN